MAQYIEDDGFMGTPQIQGEFAMIPEPLAHGPGLSPFLSVVIAAIGAVLGVTSSIIFVGGSLKQVEIDTHRLDQIEAHGLPQTALLTQQVTTVDQRIERLVAWVRDFPKTDMDHAVALAEAKAKIVDLEGAKAELLTRQLDLLQRTARMDQLLALLNERVSRAEMRLERDEADLAGLRQVADEPRRRPPSVNGR